jgi:HK97 family phage major capsid protein
MSDTTIGRLVEKRLNVAKQLHAHLDEIETRDGGEWNGEADETYTRLNADLDNFDARIKELTAEAKRSADAEEARELYGKAAAPAGAPAVKSEDDILRSMASGEIRSHEFRMPERRDLTVGTGSQGGYTVPTFMGQLHEHMIETAQILQTNVTVLNTASGESIQIPTTSTYSTAAIISEGGSVTESNPAFGQVTLDAYKYGFSVQVSAELEQDASFPLAAFLARQGGVALGNATGAHFIVGTGSSQPKGVVPASTLGVTGANSASGAFTADNLIDLYYSVIAPYRANGTWMMSDAAIAAARKLKDATSGQYLWTPGLGSAEPDTLLGKPVIADTNVVDPAATAKSVIFGDLSGYYVRLVNGVRVERSVDFAFQNDLVTYRFLLRADGDLVDTTGAVKHFIGGS